MATSECVRLERAVSGDEGDVREFVLSGGGLGPTDLVGATIVGRVWRDGVAVATLTGTVVDAARRRVSISLGGAGGWLATAAEGEWFLDVQVTFSSGAKWTWPSSGPMILPVRASG